MNKTKKIIFVIAAVLVVLGVVGAVVVITDPFMFYTEAQMQQIDSLLEENILNRYGYKEDLTPFCSHEILRIRSDGESTKVYAVYYCGGFYRENEELKSVRYVLEPIELTLNKTDGTYTLEEYWVPEKIRLDSGIELPMTEESEAYIRVHFPIRARNTETYAQSLLQACAVKAQPYFDLIEHGDSYRFTGTDVTVILSRAGDDFLLIDKDYPQLASSGTYEKNREHVEMCTQDGSIYWFERYGTDLVFDATRSTGAAANLTSWHSGIFFDYGIETCGEDAIRQVNGSYLVDVDQDGEREICAGLYYGSGSLLLVADGETIHLTDCSGHIDLGWNDGSFGASQPYAINPKYYTVELGETITIRHGEEQVNDAVLPIYSQALDEYVYAALGDPIQTVREKGDFQHYSYIFTEH